MESCGESGIAIGVVIKTVNHLVLTVVVSW